MISSSTPKAAPISPIPGRGRLVPGRPTYVYYLPAGGREPVLVDSAVPRPNGLTLTNDGKTPIVDDTTGLTVFACDVQPDGSMKNKRPFARLRNIPAGTESGADGLAIDRNDRVYITTVTGVCLGTITAGRQPANVVFAGPGKSTAYLTAREGLYRVKTLAQGPDRLRK
jgi:sugar lactone lactonase YvrE